MMKTRTVHVGKVLIGSDHPIVVQTMCNTHTSDVEATVAQCGRLIKAGAQIIRITVPALQEIRRRVQADVPLVADIHFSAEVAMAVVPVVEKIRINPGNFHPNHDKARELFGQFLAKCKEYDRAIRIGLNHGSLGKYIVEKYGNTPQAMALAAMEWVEMCIEADFYNVVVSLKASNTVVMVQAYRELARLMKEPKPATETAAASRAAWPSPRYFLRESAIPSEFPSQNLRRTRFRWRSTWPKGMGCPVKPGMTKRASSRPPATGALPC